MTKRLPAGTVPRSHVVPPVPSNVCVWHVMAKGCRAGLSTSRTNKGVVLVLVNLTAGVPLSVTAGRLLTLTMPDTGNGVFTTVTGTDVGAAGAGLLVRKLKATPE